MTRHLAPVPTGEVPDDSPQTLAAALQEIARLEDQLAGAENNVRSMRAQMAAKNRELQGEIDQDHELFPRVVAAFRYWQERTGHTRTELTPDRWKVALPFFRRHEDFTIRKAIRGAEFDPFISTRKNGTEIRHNAWTQIFANEDRFQSFVDRAPDPPEPTQRQLALMEVGQLVARRVLERARLIEEAKDPAATSHLLLEINRLLVEWLNTPPSSDLGGR